MTFAWLHQIYHVSYKDTSILFTVHGTHQLMRVLTVRQGSCSRQLPILPSKHLPGFSKYSTHCATDSHAEGFEAGWADAPLLLATPFSTSTLCKARLARPIHHLTEPPKPSRTPKTPRQHATHLRLHLYIRTPGAPHHVADFVLQLLLNDYTLRSGTKSHASLLMIEFHFDRL